LAAIELITAVVPRHTWPQSWPRSAAPTQSLNKIRIAFHAIHDMGSISVPTISHQEIAKQWRPSEFLPTCTNAK
jgi:hypothetical protein